MFLFVNNNSGILFITLDGRVFGRICVGEDWKDIISVKVCIGEIWKEVTDIKICIDGEWKESI
jgi:hypothetical protein